MEDEVLIFSEDGKSVLGCTDKSIEYVEIPDEIEFIGDNAFMGCTYLTNVYFSENLKAIGQNAFKGCTSLEGLDVPDTVKFIGAEAFESCSRLWMLSLPPYLTRIEKGLCKNCSSLERMECPNEVEIICEQAFAGCESLLSVNFPYFISKVEAQAFAGCIELKEVCFLREIPDGVSFAEGCFDGVNMDSCQLFVEQGYTEMFKNHDVLGRFRNIEAFMTDEDPMYKQKAVQLDEDEINDFMSFDDSCVRIREICKEIGIPESSVTVDDEYFEEGDYIQNPDCNGINITLHCEDGFTIRINYSYFRNSTFGDPVFGASIIVQELYKEGGIPCRMTNHYFADYLAKHLPDEIQTEGFSYDMWSYIEDIGDVSTGPAKMKEVLRVLKDYLDDSVLQAEAAKQTGYMCYEKAMAIVENINEDDNVCLPITAKIIDAEKWEISESLELGVNVSKSEYYYLISEILKNPSLNFNELITMDCNLAAKINKTSSFWVQNESETGLKPFYIDLTHIKEDVKRQL